MEHQEYHDAVFSLDELTPKKKPVWDREWKYLDIEITPFCWGLGFDFGYAYRVAVGLWAGPFYLEIHSG